MRLRRLASAASSATLPVRGVVVAGGEVRCLLRGDVEGEGAVGSLLGSSKTSLLASLSRKKFIALGAVLPSSERGVSVCVVCRVHDRVGLMEGQ